MSAPALTEIQEIARKVAESEGLDLVDVEIKTGRSRTLLRILIDRTGGASLDDCEKVSRQMSALLDVKDLISQAYVLEVSSPGTDRPLVTERDFQRVIGRMLRIRVLNPEGQTQERIGKLLNVSAEGVLLEVNGREQKIERGQLLKAVQEVVLGQPKRGSRKRK